jgi:hypothetical protein
MKTEIEPMVSHLWLTGMLLAIEIRFKGPRRPLESIKAIVRELKVLKTL